jgi:UTP--glucose-1-phosphate uridylyltransferase
MNIDGATRRELARFGFDEAQLERFARSLRDNAAATQPYVTGRIEQLTPGDASVLTAEHRERGLAALRAGEVGVVILAGGMATRFGGVVKAAVPVTHGKTFLGLKVADVAKLAMPVPIYVMTSFATHDRINDQIRDEKLTGVETFPQLVSLRLTPNGELFHEPDGALSPYATGHGDLTFALRSSGILKRFRERGGKLLFMSNVDNLGATLDPAVIGAHLAAGKAITAELVRKEKGDKGGAPARLDGTPQIIEAFRFPPSFDQDSIPLFNTNTFVFDAAAIDRDFDLTFFRVEKKVDDAKVIQFERLVGQLTAFLPTHFLEVPRGGATGRFQPVKDPEELEHRRGDIESILRARGIL